jgi:hypothetical protein
MSEEEEWQALNTSPSHLGKMHRGGTGRRSCQAYCLSVWYRLEKVERAEEEAGLLIYSQVVQLSLEK